MLPQGAFLSTRKEACTVLRVFSGRLATLAAGGSGYFLMRSSSIWCALNPESARESPEPVQVAFAETEPGYRKNEKLGGDIGPLMD
jgi:hypothetical protein